MPEKGKLHHYLYVAGLPLALFCITYGLLGFYYETNDDQLITLLLRGITIQPPLQSLSIYFYGWSQVLVRLYQWLPAVPWYGLLLYTGLLGATGLAFGLVYRASAGYLPPRLLVLLLLLFYLSSWLEHVMWFNYMRVPFLLAGTAYLTLLQLASRRVNWWYYLFLGSVFLGALCVRPSAALLGMVLVGPAFVLFSKGQTIRFAYLRPMLFLGGIALAFLLGLRLTQTPAVKEYQRLDWLKSTVIDFQIYEARPANQADSLAIQAIGHWLLADTGVINEHFYSRAGSINLLYILKETAPQKLAALASLLVRDQFLILAINGIILFLLFCRQGTPGSFSRRFLLYYEIYFWLIILLIGLFLKVPPRLITPALSLYTLVHLVLFFREAAFSKFRARMPLPVWIILGLLLGLQLYKISHRARLQQAQKQAHEFFLNDISSSFRDKILVSAVFQDYLRSLSPFINYNFGANTVFLLTGWSTLDPGYKAYFKKISGQTEFASTVAFLLHNPNTIWLLPPDLNLFLENYFSFYHRQPWPLQKILHPLSQKYPLEVYQKGRIK